MCAGTGGRRLITMWRRRERRNFSGHTNDNDDDNDNLNADLNANLFALNHLKITVREKN